jgi:tRNA (cmo5U34)-methyltransferase
MTNNAESQNTADYAQNTSRLVPGLLDMRRMAALLLSERTPHNGKVLVVGAGGGLELKCFAESHPGWNFEGVDPSSEMLELARSTLGELMPRIRLREGYVDAAPEEPFDAATCLQTLHFTSATERLRTLREIHRRLKPGAPLVVMHLSFDQEPELRSVWLSRYAAFATSSGVDPIKAQAGARAVGERLEILSPIQDEELMRDAGFKSISLFYAAFTFRGWVAYA